MKSKTPQPKPVSLRGYAKHRRCHLSSVQEARDSGRIKVDANGKIPDVAEADRQWLANTIEENRPLSGPAARKKKRNEADEADGFRTARTRRETALAEIAEVEARRLSGGQWLPATAFDELSKEYGEMFAFIRRYLRHRMPLAIMKRCDLATLAKLCAEHGARVKHVCGQPFGPYSDPNTTFRLAASEVQEAVDDVCNELADLNPKHLPVL